MFVGTGTGTVNFSPCRDGDGELSLNEKFLIDIPNLSSPWLAPLRPLLSSTRHGRCCPCSARPHCHHHPAAPSGYSAPPMQQQTEAHLSNPYSFAPYLSVLPRSTPATLTHSRVLAGFALSAMVLCVENEEEHGHKRMSRENGAHIVKE